MSTARGSVTHWIAELQAGNRQATHELWNRYFGQIARFARRKLQGLPTRMADEEDIALSALKSFFRRAENGEFPQLEDSRGLWLLLVRITACKAYNLQRDERRAKRGGGKLLAAGTFPSDDELVALAGSQPSEAFADHLVEECRRRIDRLPDAEHQQIARLILEWQSTRAIAEQLGVPQRRVQRRLKVITALWREELTA